MEKRGKPERTAILVESRFSIIKKVTHITAIIRRLMSIYGISGPDMPTQQTLGIIEETPDPKRVFLVHQSNEYLWPGFSCPEGLDNSARGQSRASRDATLGMDAHKPILL
jgi:hypothetical protein